MIEKSCLSMIGKSYHHLVQNLDWKASLAAPPFPVELSSSPERHNVMHPKGENKGENIEINQK